MTDLAALIQNLPGICLSGSGDVAVTALSADSRTVSPGTLFAALPGSKRHGLDFMPQALTLGASAVMVPTGTALTFDQASSPAVVYADDPRLVFALMAARLYGPQPETVVAVTGTNGKTSTVAFARQLWTRLGHAAASLGTLGLIGPGVDSSDGMTTPDPVVLHKALAAAAAAGCTRLALEASSHGLDQRRLDGVKIAAAAFTNLTRDHLDYHKTESAYFLAKLRLFTELLPSGGIAVVNADDPRADVIRAEASIRGRTVWTYGTQGKELRLLSHTPSLTGQRLTMEIFGKTADIALPLAGVFQAFNVMAAIGLLTASGEHHDQILNSISSLSGVPGRMQLAGKRRHGAPVYVDYAHTPDSLEHALQSLRPHAAGRLIVVFGCGGDRDPGKRPLMGEVAARLADVAIVADDNPRTEPPALIRAAIMAACAGGIEIGDRRTAIGEGVARLNKEDILLIAGKGHEQGQIVGSATLPFNDVAEARQAIQRADAKKESVP